MWARTCWTIAMQFFKMKVFQMALKNHHECKILAYLLEPFYLSFFWFFHKIWYQASQLFDLVYIKYQQCHLWACLIYVLENLVEQLNVLLLLQATQLAQNRSLMGVSFASLRINFCLVKFFIWINFLHCVHLWILFWFLPCLSLW